MFSPSLLTALVGIASLNRVCGVRVQDELVQSLSLDASVLTSHHANATAHVEATKPVHKFPPELRDKGYVLERPLACGLNGCAYLVKGPGGQKVIKVADESKKVVRSLEVECGHMRWLRYEACRGGAELLSLHEAYVPSCDDVGQVAEGKAYLVMPFAGPIVIKPFQNRSFRLQFTTHQRRAIFAQLVAAVGSLHRLGVWHNDLNSGNIILDGIKLSLIDYGLMAVEGCLSKRCRTGYSRDGNAVFRWMSVLADCPARAHWRTRWARHAPRKQLRAAQSAAEACLKQRWNADEEFLHVLRQMFAANTEQQPKQYVWELSQTEFVQKNLLKRDVTYPLDGTEGCTTWSSSKLDEEIGSHGVHEPWLK